MYHNGPVEITGSICCQKKKLFFIFYFIDKTMTQATKDMEQCSICATCDLYMMYVALKGSRMSLSGCRQEEAVSVCDVSPPVQPQQLVSAIDMSVSRALSCQLYCALLTPAVARERKKECVCVQDGRLPY